MIYRTASLGRWLDIAEQAAYAAGEILTKNKCDIKQIRSSRGHDVKISADILSEKTIISILRNKTDFPILSEERGEIGLEDKDGFVWIVDPLDGSMNFLRGIPLGCVSIGLWKNNKPFLGVIYDFNKKEVYSGIADKVAWCNKKVIKVSKVAKKKNAIICTGFPINSDFSSESIGMFIKQVQDYKKVRLLGSAALSLAYVAAGKVDAYCENDIMIWDVAAGLALVSGAGGVIRVKLSEKKNALKVYVVNGHF